MIWNCLFVLSCVTACLGSGYQSYYVPEQLPVAQHYSDGGRHGLDVVRDYDQAGHRQLQDIRDAHAARDYVNAENHGLRDFAKQGHLNQGAHAVSHASGGQQAHAQQAHDRGHYEREKKYGYEKAYGYERESKSHDRDHKAASHAGGYNHHDNRGHYLHGGEAVRDLAAHNNRHHQGSEVVGDKHILLDLGANRNRGKELLSRYNDGLLVKNQQLQPYGPLKSYLPIILRKNYVDDIDGSLNRFRYLSGIHGLGGLRGYGLGYGYNPLRYGLQQPFGYGINSLNIDGPINIHEPLNIDGQELRFLDNEPLRQLEPVSSVYYNRP